MRKCIVTSALVLFMLSFCLNFSNAYASEILTVEDFTDIPSNHWGMEAIKWGLEKKMLTGYPDNLFKPDNMVTEGEFAVILTKYADNINKENIVSIEGKHWSQPYYNILKQFELPFGGYEDDIIKNSPITRGKLAIIFSAKYGFNLGDQQAVYFLYENGLSQGRTAMNYEGYSPNAYLTRAEMVQFFRRIDNLGDTQLTFLGKQSTKGTCDADTIVGIEGVAFDETPVDFTQWVPAKPDVSPTALSSYDTSLTTKVVGGKVIAVQAQKITEPVPVDGYKLKHMNYFDFVANNYIDASEFNNAIMLYEGVELPLSNETVFPEDMITFSGAQIQIGLDGNNIADTGRFVDKAAFISLLPNLKTLHASQKQIDKAVEMINAWAGKNENHWGNKLSLVAKSKSADSCMIITYGNGNVSIAMYKGYNSVSGYGTEIIVD